MFDLLSGEAYKERHICPLPNFKYEEDYIYELVCSFDHYNSANEPYIVAYKIVDETETEWICEDRSFKKVNFEAADKINPFSTNLFYALTPEEAINLYNKNLDKFKI